LLTLENFSLKIDPTIFNRGEKYFLQNRVQELIEVKDGVWKAIVDGSEVYEIEVKINSNGEIETICSCPYDFGHHCKHEVAMLLAIKAALNRRDEAFPLVMKISKKTKKSRNKTAAIKKWLKESSKEELKEFMLKFCDSNREFKNSLYLQTLKNENIPIKNQK